MKAMKKIMPILLIAIFAFAVSVNAQDSKKTVVTIGGKNSGSITKSTIIASEKLKVDNSKQGIEYFTIFYDLNGQRKSFSSNSSSLSQEMINAINSFTKPTKVTFADILGYEIATPANKAKLGTFTVIIE